jgi:hypothetical protein
MEGKVMRSALRSIALGLTGLAMLYLASPGFAQALPVEGDPFAGVTSVDGTHMSAVSGQPGATGLPDTAGLENASDCGTACSTDSATSLATPVTQKVTYGNSTTVHVTAINNQSSSIGSAVIDTAGGLNAAGGGN